MTPGLEAATRILIDQVAPSVRATFRRKSGLSLAEDDSRKDNLDALDLYQDALVRIWERVCASGTQAPDVTDLKAYAVTVAHNLWSDYLRQKYPRRTSLKNRLRYFFEHVPRYRLWDGADGALLCGYKQWSVAGRTLERGAWRALLERREALPVPAKPMERMTAPDWDALMQALFTKLQGPVPLDDVVSLVAERMNLKEGPAESLDGETPGSGREPRDLGARSPQDEAEMRSSLQALWEAVRTLRPDYRRAYLLNIPGADRTRGDIEVLVQQGIATVRDIGEALALTDIQYRILWDSLDLPGADRLDIAAMSSDVERFCLLWKYLPLADTLIARLLGITPQQVINRRNLAVRELARKLDTRP